MKRVLTSLLPGSPLSHRRHNYWREWSQCRGDPPPWDCGDHQGIWEYAQVRRGLFTLGAAGLTRPWWQLHSSNAMGSNQWSVTKATVCLPHTPQFRLETLYGTSIRRAELEARLQYLKVSGASVKCMQPNIWWGRITGFRGNRRWVGIWVQSCFLTYV